MIKGKTRIASLLLLLFSVSADASEFEVHPIISVAEEFTDNVHETRNNRVSDFITRAMPGLILSYKTPAIESDVSYQYDYRYYARRSSRSDSTHLITAKGHITLINNLLFLDLSDQYERVSLDVTRDVTRESLFFDQVDRNIATVSPYLMFRPNEQVTLKTGYSFIDTRYSDVPQVPDSNATLDKIRHNATFEGTYEITSQLSTNIGYGFTHEEAEANDYNQHQPYGGFRYEYAESSYLFAQGGNTWIRYDNGMRLSELFWHVGVSHDFTVLTAVARTGVRYDEDPLRNITQETFAVGGIRKALQNGSVDLDVYYSEFDETRTDGVFAIQPYLRVLPSKKYGSSIRGQRELLTNLTGTINFWAEKYEYDESDSRPESTYIRRFLLETSLAYQLREEMTLTLWHTFADYQAPHTAFSELDNRMVNRIGLQFRAIF